MHIKEIVLVGFKSYRDHTVVTNIDPGLNVIVGKNGTGKSNIFNAISFVLGDAANSSLRNSVVAQRGQECYVELVFDNSDQRFLTFPEEVTFKRSLDTPNEYWINGKKTTQKDALNHLESAGFGGDNPFYVVPQGQVASLINATDEERLQLLLTASGLDLFERKKTQSTKTINKSRRDVDHIEVVLSEIDQKLKTLEEEVNVSEEYQAADLEQRELKHEQLTREQVLVDKALEECGAKLETLKAAETEIEGEFTAAENSKRIKEAEILNLSCEIDTLNATLDYYNKSDAAINTSSTDSPTDYDELIAKCTEIIAQKTADMQKASNELEEAQAEHSRVAAKLKGLQVKQAQASQFKSSAERNNWLSSQIVRAESELEALRSKASSVASEIEAIDLPMVSTEKVDNISQQLDDAKDVVLEEQKKLVDAQNALRLAQLERRKSTIQVENLEEQITSVMESSNDSTLVEVVAAIEHAKKFAAELGVSDKFYGPVANLIELDEIYAPAAEAIAKSSLFYCVVEETDVVRKIAGKMVSETAGRLSFIPLSDIKTRPALELDEADTESAALLMDMMTYESKFRPAVDLVVGNALICSDMDVGLRCSRAYNVDCVTVEGNLVSAQGALRGGSRNQNAVSRFEALSSLTDLYNKKEEALAKVVASDANVEKSQQVVTLAHNNVAKAKQQVTVIFGQLDEARREQARAAAEADKVAQEKRLKEQQLEYIQAESSALSDTLDQYKQDVSSDFIEPLNEQEVQQLGELAASKDKLEAKKAALASLLPKMQRELDDAKAQKWDAALTKERNIEVQESGDVPSNSNDAEVSRLKKEHEQSLAKESTLRAELQLCVTDVTEAAARLHRVQKEIKKQEFREEKYRELLKDNQTQQRQLGAPRDRSTLDLSDAQIEEKLQDVQSRLNRCGPVNQFAQEQYDKYKYEYNQHVASRQEVLKEIKASQRMIEKLDAYKSKAIVKTFNEVEKRFSGFFKRLTRTDTATLKAVGGSNPLRWSGLEISVSFAGHRQLKIEQLSGGQKALCALAFLLSLQASDPAPFYIFDEVDASLDNQYRGSLADTLKDISSKLEAQFICTTFGSELVQSADQVFGTAFAGSSSAISPIDKELALTLVDVNPNEVENVLG